MADITLSRGNFQSLAWAIFKAIEKNMLKAGGIIFGGYVRDRIIHDHYADKFYKSEAYKKSANPTSDYNDSSCHTESWPHRTHLPSDIDVVMSNSGFATFIQLMQEEDFIVKRKAPSKISIYTCRTPCDLMHTKCVIAMKTHSLLKSLPQFKESMPAIHVDVLHKEVLHPMECVPFGTIDFECNSLLILPGNVIDLRNGAMEFCTEKYKQINKIVEDIVSFRAVAVCPQTYRVYKMLDKGFTIMNAAINLLPQRTGNAYDGVCLICHDAFDNREIGQVRHTCCDARYHIHCYCKSKGKTDSCYDNVHNCMMCRRAIPTIHRGSLEGFLRSYCMTRFPRPAPIIVQDQMSVGDYEQDEVQDVDSP